MFGAVRNLLPLVGRPSGLATHNIGKQVSFDYFPAYRFVYLYVLPYCPHGAVRYAVDAVRYREQVRWSAPSRIIFTYLKMKRRRLLLGRRIISCTSVRLSRSPQIIVPKATVCRAMSLERATRWKASAMCGRRARIRATIDARWLWSIAGAVTPASFKLYASRVNAMHCVTKSLLTGLLARESAL